MAVMAGGAAGAVTVKVAMLEAEALGLVTCAVQLAAVVSFGAIDSTT